MPPQEKVVVDGSNIATEGRSTPSLQQLDDAVRALISENPTIEVTVVVDATFGHRIDESERPAFEEAAAHGELVSPPAGAIGRGDAFLLQIADKIDATVLSNDSFQEFHGQYDWLFSKDRLIGGKPVPGVGWIFTPRTPVRGPKSRDAVRESRRGRVKIGAKRASAPMPVPSRPPPVRSRKSVKEAIDEATREVVAPGESVAEEAGNGAGAKRGRRRRRPGPPASTVNEPLTFIRFIAEHKLGSEVTGEVESFSSHGAFVTVDGARCYIPLSAMGDPPPRSARTVLGRGEAHTFVVQALDAPRRGVELALPGFEHIAGAPTEETVEAEIEEAPKAATRRARPAAQKAQKKRAPATTKAARKKAAAKVATTEAAPVKKAVATKAAATKAPAKKAPAAKKAVTKKAVTKKAAAKKAAAKKAAARKAPAKKAVKKAAGTTTKAAKKASGTKTAEKAPAKKATASRKAPAKKAVAKAAGAAKTPAKKATRAANRS